MGPFYYRESALFCDDVPLADIAAEVGTPCYVYSSAYILQQYLAYDEALAGIPHEVCYAVKANSNLAILALLAGAGAGFDIVSAGELYRVLRAGGDPSKVVFSGVGKSAPEIRFALEQGIHSFNAESEGELMLIDEVAGQMGVKARVAVRVNPDVDASTHPYISTGLREHKFGVDIAEVEGVYARALHHPHLELEGVSCHIGSQLLNTAPMMDAVDKMLELVDRLRSHGVPITHLDLGGGLGVPYKQDEAGPDVRAFVLQLAERVTGRGLHIMVEPGRSIVGEAGVLITQVLYRKCTPQKEFVIVDAAMNDLIRPSLYQAHHEIIPLQETDHQILADVVGPVCETGDFFARNRRMASVNPGDLLAILTAGAYGFVQSSNYNSRTRPPEVMVDGDTWRIIRARETMDDLVRGETA
jgi:diaminopimelate decarboxylase